MSYQGFFRLYLCAYCCVHPCLGAMFHKKNHGMWIISPGAQFSLSRPMPVARPQVHLSMPTPMNRGLRNVQVNHRCSTLHPAFAQAGPGVGRTANVASFLDS